MATRDNGNDGAALTDRQVRTISKVLADPTRFEIVKRLAAKGSCTACADLREAFPVTPATLSHHMKELETAGLVEMAKRGKFVDVRFVRDTWDAYLAALREI